jgi:ubiquinone/menaquinone biosynthesis C-methylase UbiE
MFSDPKKNIQQAEIHPGMIVADIGAGSGHYSIETAKALMNSGKVYIIDVQKDLLVRIKNLATKDKLANMVEIVWGDVERENGTGLADSSVDIALLCNVLFQLKEKKVALNEIKRILVPGGRVLLVDWSDSFGGLGPHKDMVIKEEDAVDLFQKNGFAKVKNIQAGSHHYGFIFKKL